MRGGALLTNLADRWGLARHDWWTPAAFTASAFAVGIQLALIVQAAGGEDYPGEGRGWLALLSFVVLGAALFLHVPFDVGRNVREQVEALLARLPQRRAREVELEPLDEDAPRSSPERGEAAASTGAEAAQRLKIRVHTPLALGPVVAPGEPLPITINAEPAELAEELNVTIEVEQGGKRRSSTVAMTAPNVVHSETLEEEGVFTLIVTIKHPHAEAATKRIEGRVRTYREEVGRIFDELKADAENAGLDVAKHSTPRELARALARARLLPKDHVDGLVENLQVALYDDTEVDRSTYETVYAIVRKVRFEAREVPS